VSPVYDLAVECSSIVDLI